MRKMLTTIHRTVWALVFAILAVTGIAPATSAYTLQEGIEAAHGTSQPTELFGSAGVVTSLTNILLFIVGALSVIMIIVGGLRYVISGGNSTAVSAAKNTILYSIVGLIIAFLAFAAVNFVLGSLAPGSTGAGYTDV